MMRGLCHRPGRGHAGADRPDLGVIFGTLGEPYKGWLMGTSWVINLVVAEWIIRRKRAKGPPQEKAPVVSALGRPSIQATCLIEGGFSHETIICTHYGPPRSASAQRG